MRKEWSPVVLIREKAFLQQKSAVVTKNNFTITGMVAELLNCPTDAIHFGLLIASCDCNITTSVSRVGHIIAAAVKI